MLPRQSDSQSRAIPLMGTLSHQGGRRITSGCGVLRCSPRGRETIIPRPLWPTSTWHSRLCARSALQTTPALFPRKGEITSACLFIPCLGTRSLSTSGGRPRGGGRGPGPGSQSTVPSFYQTRGLGHYLSQNLPFPNEEANPKRVKDSLKIAQWTRAGAGPPRGLQRRAVWTAPRTTPGSQEEECCGMTRLGFHSTGSTEKRAGEVRV